MAMLAQLGQPLYGCQTPDGWHDTEADWLNPNAITQRVNFATALASGRLPLQRVDDPDAPAAGATASRRWNARPTARWRATRPSKARRRRSTPPRLLATLGPAISDRTRAAVAGVAARAARRARAGQPRLHAPLNASRRLPMQRRQLLQAAAAAGLAWTAVGRTRLRRHRRAGRPATARQQAPGRRVPARRRRRPQRGGAVRRRRVLPAALVDRAGAARARTAACSISTATSASTRTSRR